MQRFAMVLFTLAFVPLKMPGGQALTAEQQIAQAVLPLPESLRAGAKVLGYDEKLTLTTLRKGSNAMVCTADRPGDDHFDVRCYHEAFMPAIQRARELRSQGLEGSAVDQEMDKEIKAGSIKLPNHARAGLPVRRSSSRCSAAPPVRYSLISCCPRARLPLCLRLGCVHDPPFDYEHPAGYRMLGPIGAYDAATNQVTGEIRRWQSLHLRFQTAADLSLPTESKPRHALRDGFGHLVGTRDDRALNGCSRFD